MLQPGEFVIRKSAVQAFGTGNLSKINKYGKGGISKIQSRGARDGDSWSVNYIPSGEEVGPVTTRANGIDAYELGEGMRWEQNLAKIATEMADKYYTTRNMSDKSALFKDLIQGQFSVGRRPVHNIPNALRREMLDAGVAMPAKKENTATGKTGKRPSKTQRETLRANGYAKGGSVKDTVPALLTPGEFVINKQSASAFGYGNLKKINGYNKGGVVDGIQTFKNGGFAERAKNFAVSSVTNIDQALEKIGGITTAIGGAGAVISGYSDTFGDALDNLTGSAVSASASFQSASRGLQGLSSGVASGSVLGRQVGGAVGFGRQGAMIGAAAGGITQLVDGALKGYQDGLLKLQERSVLAAENAFEIASEDFDAAINNLDIVQAYEDQITATNNLIATQDKLAETANSTSTRLSGAASSFVTTFGNTAAILAPILGGGRSAVKKSSGGPIYASKGRLVNFEPKGSDTVPAMLTPGEFVVNREATKNNRSLLETINSSRGGRVEKPQYRVLGGLIASVATPIMAAIGPAIGPAIASALTALGPTLAISAVAGAFSGLVSLFSTNTEAIDAEIKARTGFIKAVTDGAKNVAKSFDILSTQNVITRGFGANAQTVDASGFLAGAQKELQELGGDELTKRLSDLNGEFSLIGLQLSRTNKSVEEFREGIATTVLAARGFSGAALEKELDRLQNLSVNSKEFIEFQREIDKSVAKQERQARQILLASASTDKLTKAFSEFDFISKQLSGRLQLISGLQEEYVRQVDATISGLRGATDLTGSVDRSVSIALANRDALSVGQVGVAASKVGSRTGSAEGAQFAQTAGALVAAGNVLKQLSTTNLGTADQGTIRDIVEKNLEGINLGAMRDDIITQMTSALASGDEEGKKLTKEFLDRVNNAGKALADVAKQQEEALIRLNGQYEKLADSISKERELRISAAGGRADATVYIN